MRAVAEEVQDETMKKPGREAVLKELRQRRDWHAAHGNHADAAREVQEWIARNAD